MHPLDPILLAVSVVVKFKEDGLENGSHDGSGRIEFYRINSKRLIKNMCC